MQLLSAFDWYVFCQGMLTPFCFKLIVISQLITCQTQIPYEGYVIFMLTTLMLLAITITPATASPVLMFCMKDEKVYDRSETLRPAVLPTDNDSNIIRALQAANR